MTTIADIEKALRAALPPELHSIAADLARIFADAGSGAITTDEAKARLMDPAFAPALNVLIGQTLDINGNGSHINILGDINTLQSIAISGGTLQGPIIGTININYSTITRSQRRKIKIAVIIALLLLLFICFGVWSIVPILTMILLILIYWIFQNPIQHPSKLQFTMQYIVGYILFRTSMFFSFIYNICSHIMKKIIKLIFPQQKSKVKKPKKEHRLSNRLSAKNIKDALVSKEQAVRIFKTNFNQIRPPDIFVVKLKITRLPIKLGRLLQIALIFQLLLNIIGTNALVFPSFTQTTIPTNTPLQSITDGLFITAVTNISTPNITSSPTTRPPTPIPTPIPTLITPSATMISPLLSDNEVLEQRIIELINQERLERGCSVQLQYSIELANAARRHSYDMATQVYDDVSVQAQQGSDGSDRFSRAREAGYTGAPGSRVREDIVVGTRSEEQIVYLLSRDPIHQGQMLDCAYNDIGVGFTRVGGSQYTDYITVMYGRRSS